MTPRHIASLLALLLTLPALQPVASGQGANECGVPVNEDGVPTDDEGFVSVVIIGTDDIDDKQQGMFTDDASTGGDGFDLHPFTEGQDVITDFDPAKDMIDVGDFARPSDGFATLQSLADIAELSTQATVDGQTALVIDVDGPLGSSTTTLLGITIDDFTEDNVFFGLGGTSIPPQPVTWASAQCVTTDTGCRFVIPGHEVPGSSGQSPANPSDPCGSTSTAGLAGLIVPGFEIDIEDPQGPSTFFAVRNTSDAALEIDVAYHGAQITDPPLRIDTLVLGPQQTVSANVGADLTDLAVSEGFATGLIQITESGSTSAGSLVGDFFHLDQANAFATGDRLVQSGDFCSRQEVRFVDFGSGSRFKILVRNPQGTEQPSFTYTAYGEPGSLLARADYFTADHLTAIDLADLGIADAFGTLLFDFSNSGGGWVSARYSAFGLYSVELSSACWDG